MITSVPFLIAPPPPSDLFICAKYLLVEAKAHQFKRSSTVATSRAGRRLPISSPAVQHRRWGLLASPFVSAWRPPNRSNTGVGRVLTNGTVWSHHRHRSRAAACRSAPLLTSLPSPGPRRCRARGCQILRPWLPQSQELAQHLIPLGGS